MVALRDLPQLGDDLDRLAGALEALSVPPHPAHASLDAERRRLARTIRDYLIPRVEDPEAPLMVVFAGPTGSGKSTLINSLTGLELSIAGPIRPTTESPLVLTGERWSAELETVAGVACDVVEGGAAILESMILVDTPDIDSTSTDHRETAETLIDNADVVVFVTSALRYADAVPWQVLRRAESRGTDVIHVLNRVGSETRGAVVDFRSRLFDAGLDDEVVTVPEHRIAPGAQRVPSVAVRSLRRKLAMLGGDRAATADRAFDRVLMATLRQVGRLEGDMTEVADALASFEAQLTLDLTSRAAALDLSGVGGRLLSAPTGDMTREARRWRRAERRGGLTSAEVDDVVGAIETLAIRDLRHWLAGRPTDAPNRPEPRLVLPVIVPVIRLAMEGWIDYVSRIARDEGGRRPGLAEVVLVVSATDSEKSGVAHAFFGERAHDVVGRARRELIGRLEVVYEQVGALVTELIETRDGEPDLSGLRAALGAVTSALAPVDA
ncbi:MAG TPA: GTPase [Acidimicrobiia bacterium]